MKKIILFFVISIAFLVNCKNEGKLIDSEINENLKNAGFDVVDNGLKVLWNPDDENRKDTSGKNVWIHII